jgi:hypothetical protein
VSIFDLDGRLRSGRSKPRRGGAADAISPRRRRVKLLRSDLGIVNQPAVVGRQKKRSIRERLMNWIALSKPQEVLSGHVASIARYIKCLE